MLFIRLLGTPLILQDDQPLTIARKKSRALVYYLAAHDKPLTRDQLLAVFWPDSERASAQQVLRTTLHGLRQALGAALIVEENTLALAPDVNIDVRAFESHLQRPISMRSVLSPRAASNDQSPIASPDIQLLSSTLALYRGDFLADFSLNDSVEFDDWLAGQQEHYRRLAIRGFIALASLHEQQGNYQAALAALDRALAFDPLQEDVQRSALRLHYLMGDRAGAIRRYEALRKLLNREMGVPPMAETRALYDDIINDKLIRDQGSAISDQALSVGTKNVHTVVRNPQFTIRNLPFTGRGTELNQLRAAAASRQLALLEGEPGIGKTRLAEEYLHTLTAFTLRSTAHELESALPYQPISAALRDLLAAPD